MNIHPQILLGAGRPLKEIYAMLSASVEFETQAERTEHAIDSTAVTVPIKAVRPPPRPPIVAPSEDFLRPTRRCGT